MKGIMEESSFDDEEEKGGPESLQSGKSTGETNSCSDDKCDCLDHRHDHTVPTCSLKKPSETEDCTPIQCTEDKLLRLHSETGCSRSELDNLPHSEVMSSIEDIDLPHDTCKTGLSEEKGYSCKLHMKAHANHEKYVDNEEQNLKYTAEKKIPVSNQVESVKSYPLDIMSYLKPRSGFQQCLSVYMLPSFSAHASTPNLGKQSDDSLSLSKQYMTELSRLATYTDYPSDIRFFAISLAKDGFIFLRDEQSIKCCFCKLDISLAELRKSDAEPANIHYNRSPECPLKRGESSGKVLVPRRKENDTASNNPGHDMKDSMGRDTSEEGNTNNDSHNNNLEDEPPDLWYQKDKTTVLPSPVVHHENGPDTTTDSAPVIQQAQVPHSPSRRNIDSVGQQQRSDSAWPGLQRPNLPINTSPPRGTATTSLPQHLEGAAAHVNVNGTISGDSISGNRPSISPSSSRQNETTHSRSVKNGAASSSTANMPKNPKPSKKGKAAKKSEAAVRKMPTKPSNSSMPVQNFSNKYNAISSSDTGEQTKEKKKINFEDLGIMAEKPKRPDMATLQKRLGSYEGKWKTSFAKTPQSLAECGMYYAGYADCARCFFCAGGLKNWEASDEPWIEHARWFPKCSYLLLCKGHDFVNIVQTKNKKNEKIILKNVEEEIRQRTKNVATSAVSLPASVNVSSVRGACGGLPTGKLVSDLKELEAEHEELTIQITCKICMDELSSVVFLPCGHMVACTDCAVVLKQCPLCRADIRGTVKAQTD